MKGSAGVAIKRILARPRRFAMPLEPLAAVTVGSFGRLVGNASVTFWPVHATRAPLPGRSCDTPSSAAAQHPGCRHACLITAA